MTSIDPSGVITVVPSCTCIQNWGTDGVGTGVWPAVAVATVTSTLDSSASVSAGTQPTFTVIQNACVVDALTVTAQATITTMP